MTQGVHRWRPWIVPALLTIGVLTVATVLGQYAEDSFAAAHGGGRTIQRTPAPPADLPTLLHMLGVGSVVWYVAAVSLPLLVFGARRLDVERLGTLGTIAIVGAVGVMLIVVTSVIEYSSTYAGLRHKPPIRAYALLALRQHVLPLATLIGGVAAVEARRRAIRSAMDRERLQAEVARQRLIALSGQLRPHFLFNTLQAISTLIRRDPEGADEMLTKLSELLSEVLRHRDSPFVRLEDEVRYARTWLEIAKVRFGERLDFEIDVPADLEDVMVPLFILQPLIENALSHGIGGRLQGGRVVLRASRAGSRLRLQVIDDGAGIQDAGTVRLGVGLSNTRERLQTSFGDDHGFSYRPLEGGGTIVTLEMPARTVSAVQVPA